MAHPGRPATKLQITDAERAELHARQVVPGLRCARGQGRGGLPRQPFGVAGVAGFAG